MKSRTHDQCRRLRHEDLTVNTIYPTRTCFDDVLEHQVELAGREPELAARQLVVHGICLAPEDTQDDGTRFAHAWVEDGDMLWQSGLLEDGTKVWYGMARDEWYAKMRVQDVTRYTLGQALAENYTSAHFGPWVPRYREPGLCGGGRVFR